MKRLSGLFFFAVFVLLTLAAAGCTTATETDQANQLVGEVNQLKVDDDLTQVGTLISQALTAQASGQPDAASQSLTKAEEHLNAAANTLQTAYDKLDQAASMNITEEYQSYLESKLAAVEASQELVGIFKQEIDLVASDPGMENPDSSTKLADLAQKADAAAKSANDAEMEASRKASESDQIE